MAEETEEKKKKSIAPIDDPPPEPEPEPDEDDDAEDDGDDGENPEAKAEVDEEIIFEEKIKKVLEKLGVIEAPAAPVEVEEIVKAERQRISGLLAYGGVVSDATLRQYIADGKTINELGLFVLEQKKAEHENRLQKMKADAKNDEPLCFVNEAKKPQNTKSTVLTLAAELMPKGHK